MVWYMCENIYMSQSHNHIKNKKITTTNEEPCITERDIFIEKEDFCTNNKRCDTSNRV